MKIMPDAGLYIHIPFCLSKCGYCDFNSVVYDRPTAGRYLAALAGEMTLLPRSFRPRTVFVGGGTPTSLSEEELKRLFEALRKSVDLSQVSEFSVEANPATIDAEKLSVLRGAGVNRMSLGAQSFSDALLGTLGRIHSSKDIRDTVGIVRDGGIENISLDMIFAIPGQTVDMWREDMHECCELEPEHISTYCLTWERGTPLLLQAERGEVKPLSEDAEAEMYRAAMQYLPERGYRQYEVSSFARPGRECRHNLLYWHNRTTYAAGAGAYSYVEGVRSANAGPVKEYIDLVEETGSPEVFREKLAPEDRARETAVLMLRTRDGIDKAAFARDTGFAPDDFINDDLKRLTAEGFLRDEDGRLFLTDRGFPVADSILVHLLR